MFLIYIFIFSPNSPYYVKEKVFSACISSVMSKTKEPDRIADYLHLVMTGEEGRGVNSSKAIENLKNWWKFGITFQTCITSGVLPASLFGFFSTLPVYFPEVLFPT